jgi:hypothetical protein
MHGLADASDNPQVIERWWGMWKNANIAIALEPSQLVDIAPDSLQWWSEFVARCGTQPDTLSFASGGGEGHEHWLFARPEGCPAYRLTESGKFDILSHGYCIAPPSLHRSGQRYRWLPDGRPPTAWPTLAAPAWAVDMLRSKQRPPGGETVRSDDEGGPPLDLRGEALERWYGRLYERNPQGELDRSYSLWWLAVALLEAGARPSFAEQLLAERDVALGWEKFSERRDASARYRIIVDRAVASKGPRRVRLNGHTVFSNGHVTATPQPAVWTNGGDLEDMEDEDVTWFAHGMLGGGLLSELDGKVKQAGKTTLILAMTRAILEGETFLGQDTVYSPVVYLTEQSAPSFKRNLRRAGLLGRRDLHILLWNRVVGWKWPDIVAEARRKAIDVGARVIVVDTLSQFSGIRGDNENSSGAAMQVMEHLQALSADKLAVLVSRHDRKSGGDVGDSGRGSSAYAGVADVILHLQRLMGRVATGRERQRLLEGISRFEETPDKLLIELAQHEPYTYTALGDVDVLRSQTLRREILATLPNNPDDGLSTAELKEAVAAKHEDLLRVLNELIRERLVLKVGLGKKNDPFRYYQRTWDDDDDDDAE